MAWSEADDHGSELEDRPSQRWPLSGRELYPRERWLWYEQLWSDACMLRTRYRLPVYSGWWENELQVEALAALAAWVDRYDSGEWDEPAGKLALLFDLEHVASLLRRDGVNSTWDEAEWPGGGDRRFGADVGLSASAV